MVEEHVFVAEHRVEIQRAGGEILYEYESAET
jgi:hypothetical protein